MRETIANKLISKKWSMPDTPILSQIMNEKWTAHNIPLTESESTINDNKAPLIGDHTRTRTIKKHLSLFALKEGGLAGLKLLDLGSLEGGVAFEMAREDMDVVGVEGRQSNYRKCKLIEDYYKLPNLRFLHLDANELKPEVHGIFDIVLCLGLLYHLDAPAKFLDLLGSMTHGKSILFLDTHVAPTDQESPAACAHREALSDLTQIEYKGHILDGRWFQEFPQEAQGTDDAWASLSNYRSFWLTQNSLIRSIYYAGFKNIYSLYGAFDIEDEFKLRTYFSRMWCIATK